MNKYINNHLISVGYSFSSDQFGVREEGHHVYVYNRLNHTWVFAEGLFGTAHEAMQAGELLYKELTGL